MLVLASGVVESEIMVIPHPINRDSVDESTVLETHTLRFQCDALGVCRPQRVARVCVTGVYVQAQAREGGCVDVSVKRFMIPSS